MAEPPNVYIVAGPIHDDPARLPQASTIGLATAALLAAWGLFIWFNRSAEELEPEAMAKAKSEDEDLETG